MKTTVSEYAALTKTHSPNSPKAKDFILAFVSGGTVCVIGQLFKELYTFLEMSEEQVKMLVPVTLVFLAAVLTGLRLFHKIAKHTGAGTFVPITGFANSVVSPAIEFKREGFVLGLGANMFKIAGPVLVYGTVASAVYGMILFLFQK